MLFDSHLELSVGQASAKGLKSQNEDCIGMCIPSQPVLTVKGVVSIIADGVSAAEAGKEASETCVRNFISDYYATPDAWSVKKRGQKILFALNRWLVGQSQIKGHITTLSSLILKSQSAYIFHIGDTRIYRLREGILECLTQDHCTRINKETTYLSRAMGMDSHLEVDFQTQDTQLNDLYFLSTDGIHDYLTEKELHTHLLNCKGLEAQASFDDSCQRLIDLALESGSTDNLSCQIIRIDALPDADNQEIYNKMYALKFPPILEAGQRMDGYQVIKEIHSSQRSQVYLVKDASDTRYIIKTPSLNYEDDPAYIERFALEQWIGKRVDSPYVVKVIDHQQAKSALYTVMEYVDGITLEKWIRENPKPDINEVVRIAEFISRGIRALHRRDIVHQDIKPDNIIIDRQGVPRIIDFGSCLAAGVAEIDMPFERDIALGTAYYSAPETRFNNTTKTNKSDLFSLAVIVYEMLTGKMPYKDQLENLSDQRKLNSLKYQSALQYNPMVPYWLDGALEKALSPQPEKRHEAFSEFIYELKKPNKLYKHKSSAPLIEKNPLAVWQGIAALEAIILLILCYYFFG